MSAAAAAPVIQYAVREVDRDPFWKSFLKIVVVGATVLPLGYLIWRAVEEGGLASAIGSESSRALNRPINQSVEEGGESVGAAFSYIGSGLSDLLKPVTDLAGSLPGLPSVGNVSPSPGLPVSGGELTEFLTSGRMNSKPGNAALNLLTGGLWGLF